MWWVGFCMYIYVYMYVLVHEDSDYDKASGFWNEQTIIKLNAPFFGFILRSTATLHIIYCNCMITYFCILIFCPCILPQWREGEASCGLNWSTLTTHCSFRDTLGFSVRMLRSHKRFQLSQCLPERLVLFAGGREVADIRIRSLHYIFCIMLSVQKA
jgi:hypothetical protein